MIDKGDVVLFLGSKEGRAIVGSTKADRLFSVVENDRDERRRGDDETLEDTTVGVKGVGVMEVLCGEFDSMDEEGPVGDEFFATGDAENSHEVLVTAKAILFALDSEIPAIGKIVILKEPSETSVT